MSLNPSFDLVTNPASLCLSVPILALFAFLGYVAVAFIKDQADARQQQTRVEATLATFGVDRMSQAEFRQFVAGLLRKQGYAVRLPSPGHDEAEQDFGLELIAVKMGRRALSAPCATTSRSRLERSAMPIAAGRATVAAQRWWSPTAPFASKRAS